MSTSVNHYVLYGVDVPYDALDDDDDRAHEACEAYLDGTKIATNPKGNVTVIRDGMNGSYMLIGHVVSKSEDHGGISLISLDDYEMYKPGWADEIATVCIDLGLDPANYTLGWHVISHWR